MKHFVSRFVIGLDFGTDSVRALLVNAHTGEEIEHAVHFYTRWKKGLYCDAHRSQFRQHPLDYQEGLEVTIKEVLSKVSKDIAENIIGLSIDTTGTELNIYTCIKCRKFPGNENILLVSVLS